MELSVKDAMLDVKKNKAFSEVQNFMVTLYKLCKKAPKFSRHLRATGQALDVHVLKFKKVHGTRFIGILLHNEYVHYVEELFNK